MSRIISVCALLYLTFAGVLYYMAFRTAGTLYVTVNQAQGMALGADFMLFIAGIALASARNEYLADPRNRTVGR